MFALAAQPFMRVDVIDMTLGQQVPRLGQFEHDTIIDNKSTIEINKVQIGELFFVFVSHPTLR